MKNWFLKKTKAKKNSFLLLVSFILLWISCAILALLNYTETNNGFFRFLIIVLGIIMMISFLSTLVFFVRTIIYSVKENKYQFSSLGKYKPVKFSDGNIHINSKEFFKWKIENQYLQEFEIHGILPLTKKEPTISLYEDGVKTREYCLQTEDDEDFTGKYFLISVRLHLIGSPAVPVAQIDGFVSDTKKDREMTTDDVGYRMEGHFLLCGGDEGKNKYETLRGRDLVDKGLKYPGYTTPSNVRLMGICPKCSKSFSFHGYALYMAQKDVAYSDDGLDCCEITDYNFDKNTWECQIDGKTFRYYNSFNCPHCGTPYIDYKKYPESKVFGVSGCVHLGRKIYQSE